MQHIRYIGTRGSPLALFQARAVQSLLQSHDPSTDWQIRILKTSGDRIQGELKDFGGKGLFTRELEIALLDNTIDVAVHSMKDVPTVGHERLVIPAILPREDVRDAFISTRYASIADLPDGAVVGTASLRRRAQLSAIRPDVEFCLLRGNVQTRLRKLEDGVCDATFLAVAGLKRLDEAARITEAVDTDVMLPAPAQGAIGIEMRREDTELRSILEQFNDIVTERAITIERAFLRALDGSCRTPIAALATFNDDAVHFRGEVLSKDGQRRFFTDRQIDIENTAHGYAFGFKAGQRLRNEIGNQITFDD